MAGTIVIGAGIIGATTALYLARAGESVTVIDSRPEPGLETSYANGGLLAANSCLPWSSPGTPGLLLKWLGREDVPLTLRPRAIPGLGLWGLRFLANCRKGKYRRTSAALTRLAQESLVQMDAVLEAGLVDAEIWRGGHLEIFRGPEAARRAEDTKRFLEGLGAEVDRLDPAACLALEPSLEPIRGGIGAGLLLKNDAWGDARLFAAASAAGAARLGVRFKYGCAAGRLEVDRGKVCAVHADGQRLAADRVVVCAGPYANRLLGAIGLRLPISPVKGYSMTLRKEDIGFLPRLPVLDEFERITATPLGDRLRVAGTVEFDGFNPALRPGRVANLRNAFKRLYPGVTLPREINAWCGLRPMSADGLPFIDAAGIDGLYLNTGHGAVGWTLACGSADLITRIVTGKAPRGASPFRLNRRYW
ncbi:MAG TPA: FAD-dependent oxidoreductase [Dongiaceae bacterium]|nr:FAD-dependent oxidoreductase [Dongiaceae bacterium]